MTKNRTTNTGKNEKFARKRCPPNQLYIKLITKNNKNLRFHFFSSDHICEPIDARFCDTVKRRQKPPKKGHICKNHENWF